MYTFAFTLCYLICLLIPIGAVSMAIFNFMVKKKGIEFDDEWEDEWE